MHRLLLIGGGGEVTMAAKCVRVRVCVCDYVVGGGI